jgi:thymidylate synthase (FAD)
VLGGVRLSASAWRVVRRMLDGDPVAEETSGLGKREWRELMAALGRG